MKNSDVDTDSANSVADDQNASMTAVHSEAEANKATETEAIRVTEILEVEDGDSVELLGVESERITEPLEQQPRFGETPAFDLTQKARFIDTILMAVQVVLLVAAIFVWQVGLHSALFYSRVQSFVDVVDKILTLKVWFGIALVFIVILVIAEWQMWRRSRNRRRQVLLSIVPTLVAFVLCTLVSPYGNGINYLTVVFAALIALCEFIRWVIRFVRTRRQPKADFAAE